MRDPNRIPIILEALGNLWRKHPQQRLGQLLSNCLDRIELRKEETSWEYNARRHLNSYNMEDSDILEKIKQFDKEFSSVEFEGNSYRVYWCAHMMRPPDKPCPAKALSEKELMKHCVQSGHPYTGRYYLNAIALE